VIRLAASIPKRFRRVPSDRRNGSDFQSDDRVVTGAGVGGSFEQGFSSGS
jgi:hypothetical protein